MTHLSIRTIYFYLFALLGLILLVIGLVRLVNLGLKVYIFTKADQEIYMHKPAPPVPTINGELKYEDIEEVAKICKDDSNVNLEYRQFLNNWLSDYRAWKSNTTNIKEIITAQRQREAASALAFIIIGLPLYFYHWKTIRKENI